MSLYFTSVKPYFEKGLIEELYMSKGNFVICSLANWKLAVISTNLQVVEQVGAYVGFYVDTEFAKKLIADPRLFVATAISSNKGFEEGFVFSQQGLNELLEIKDKVDNGDLKTEIDHDFVLKLKEQYVNNNNHIINKYGCPPSYSKKKVSTLMWLSILFTSFGAPFFYIGQPLLGLLCLAISLISCATTFFPLMFIIAFWGIYVAPFLILNGKFKDQKRLVITTKANQEKYTYLIGVIEKYKTDISQR